MNPLPQESFVCSRTICHLDRSVAEWREPCISSDLATTSNPKVSAPIPQSPLPRWLRFNLIGALGLAVQLGSLALLHHAYPTHALATTAAAVELTLLHNLTWHWHFTWRDRRQTTTPLRAFTRFHLSNGAVSLLGNLLLVRLLLHLTHTPLLLANLLAVLLCSFANYLIGDNWVFAATAPQRPPAFPSERRD